MPPVRRALVVSSRAERDIARGSAWYERQRTGLSIEFVHALDRVFAAVLDRSGSFPIVRGRVRRALVRRFPFGVFFVDSETDVVILAVIHARRDPRVWPSRPAR